VVECYTNTKMLSSKLLEDSNYSVVVSLRTPTQKAIGAYRHYLKKLKDGDRERQEDVAKAFGTSKLMMSRARKLELEAGATIVDSLFNGKKINIVNNKGQTYATDTLLTLLSYYTKKKETDIANYSKSTDVFSIDELDIMREDKSSMFSAYTEEMLVAMNKDIWVELQRLKTVRVGSTNA